MTFEDRERALGKHFKAAQSRTYRGMVGNLVGAGIISESLADTIKSDMVETLVRLAVVAERDLKTATAADSESLFRLGAKMIVKDENIITALVKGMQSLVNIGMGDPSFGLVPAPDDTSDNAIGIRRGEPARRPPAIQYPRPDKN